MGVRCRQATAMLNTEPHRIEGRFASVLQALAHASFLRGPGLATTPRRSHCTAAAIDGERQKPSLSFLLRPAPN